MVDLHEHRTPEVYIGFGKMTTTAQAGPSFGEEEAGRERERALRCLEDDDDGGEQVRSPVRKQR